MKTNYLILIFALIAVNAYSQLTITDVDLVGVGDIIYMATDTMPGAQIVPGPSGSGQNWDLSTLQVQELDTIEIISPSGTPYSAMYANANLCFEDDGQYVYLSKSPAALEIVGLDNFPINFYLCPLPLSYGLTHTEGPSTLIDTVFPNNMFVPDTFALLVSNFQAQRVDSMRFLVTSTTNFNVDGRGQLTIPAGTFQSLRMYVENLDIQEYFVYCTDTLFGGTGSGWYSSSILFPTEVSAEYKYQWWTKDPAIKFMAAELTLDTLGGIVTNVNFYDSPQLTAISEQTSISCQVYPVPASYQIFVETQASNTQYELYDMKGNVLFKNHFNNTTTIDLSNLAKGSYLLNIITDKGNISKKVLVE